MRSLRLLSLMVVLGVLLAAPPAQAELGLLGGLKAKVMSRVHPDPGQRRHYRHVFAGWKRQRLGQRREVKAKIKLSLLNFASKVVENPRVVDQHNRYVTVNGSRYEPDLAIVRRIGPLKWAELVEVSTAGERTKWLKPHEYPGEHKANQRIKSDTVFSRPGRLYLRDGDPRQPGDQMIPIYKSGPLSVRKPGHVHFWVER